MSEHREVEARPTNAPVTVAIGVMLLFWSPQTHWIVASTGAIVIAHGIWKWIVEVRAQWREEDSHA